jgi:spermidine synthase
MRGACDIAEEIFLRRGAPSRARVFAALAVRRKTALFMPAEALSRGGGTKPRRKAAPSRQAPPNEPKGFSVLPWTLLDTAQIPGGADKLRLMRRGAEFSIMLDDIELMNSRVGGSEEALAKLSCGRISAHGAPRILIGGLGMGFTLRAALALLGEKAQLVVAELVPQVVAWARGPLAEVFGASLADPRVSIQETDVGRLIRSAHSTYDAILLDVDNGPEGLTRDANDALYDMPGLRAARAALRPGGVLAVWSSSPDRDFSQRLARAGMRVEEFRVRAHGARGARHVIWIATRPDEGSQGSARKFPSPSTA